LSNGFRIVNKNAARECLSVIICTVLEEIGLGVLSIDKMNPEDIYLRFLKITSQFLFHKLSVCYKVINETK
jgi:hypothetical protein